MELIVLLVVMLIGTLFGYHLKRKLVLQQCSKYDELARKLIQAYHQADRGMSHLESSFQRVTPLVDSIRENDVFHAISDEWQWAEAVHVQLKLNMTVVDGSVVDYFDQLHRIGELTEKYTNYLSTIETVSSVLNRIEDSLKNFQRNKLRQSIEKVPTEV